jgi:transcriptional regulator with XRE-family HTH domain
MLGRSLLETARVARGLTQAAVARRAGTSQPTLSAYERGTRSPTLAVAERILATLGYDLSLQPRVTFQEHHSQLHPSDRRTYVVPDQLWRLDPRSCFAPFIVRTPTGRVTFDVRTHANRQTTYLWLIRYGREEDQIAHLDAALLIDIWPDIAPHVPDEIREAWGHLVNATIEGWFIDKFRDDFQTPRPKPISKAAHKRAIRALADHGLTHDQILAILARRRRRLE